MREWIAFWDTPHSIYVNARHRDVHYRTIAADVLRYLPGPEAVVLDYGCGEALHAETVAAQLARLVLVDAAPGVRASLVKRFAGDPRITVRAPEQLAAMPAACVDLVVMISVAQYLTSAELDAALREFRRLLRPDGRLVWGDVVPPSGSPLADAWSLLRFARAHGFTLAALGGLARTTLSPYRRLRASLGLATYDEEAARAKLAAAGFAASRVPNVGYNAHRMTFLAAPSTAGAAPP